MTTSLKQFYAANKTAAILFILTFFLVMNVSAQEQQRPINNNDSASHRKDGAPNYCPIEIEEKRFLHITSVFTQIIDDNTIRILVKYFWTGNPFDCEGSTCYEFNEHDNIAVAGYIDWNGDKEFTAIDDPEILASPLTDSLKLKMDDAFYNDDKVVSPPEGGTGSFSTVVSIPKGAKASTWMRVFVGVGGGADACRTEGGEIGDMQDFPLNLDPLRPEITFVWENGIHSHTSNKSILLTDDIGIPGIDEEIELEAEYDEGRGYDIAEFRWSGDFPEGTENPYKFSLSPGEHGNKSYLLRMTYKNIDNGDVNYQEVDRQVKVFFDKDGDDDLDYIPNWFTYWDIDGAVPGLSEARYNQFIPGYAAAWYDDPNIEFGPHAASWAGPTFTLNTAFGLESFHGSDIKGIDYTASVLAHEKSHKWVSDQWKGSAGLFVGSIDSDNGSCPGCSDQLPDWYEREILLTDSSNTDTYNLGRLIGNVYHFLGDNEYRAMRAENGPEVKGVASKDWAFPGKQSGTSSREGNVHQRRADHPLLAIGDFSGVNSEQTSDLNTNNLFEQLLVTTEINVSNSGRFIVAGVLKDSLDNRITSFNELHDLDSGSQEVVLDFDGFLINAHGIDGPYFVDIFMNSDLLHNDSFSVKQQRYITNAYNYADFEHYGAAFNNAIVVSAEDIDSDSQFDSLVFDVGIDAVDAAQFKIKATLFDDNNNAIQSIKIYRNLATGTNTVRLSFDGSKISDNRKNGPFHLRYLSVEKGNEFADFILDAFTTNAYNIADFEKEEVYFNGSINGYGLDIDSSGKYEYLIYDIGMHVEVEGYYKIFGTLCDTGGANIVRSSRWLSLAEGDTIYPFYFEGDSIFDHGINGPYTLKSLLILDGDGDILDHMDIADTTEVYQYTEFGFSQEPLVEILGNYSDKLLNSDSNCMAEGIAFSFDLITYDTGWVYIKVRLEDQSYNEIIWLEHYERFSATNTPKTITLEVDAGLLNDYGADGPYVLKHIFAHMTLNQTPSALKSPSYRTANYNLTQFDSLDGSINHVTRTICQGESFEFADSIFTQSTTYAIDLKNQLGCDSTVQLNLTVASLPNINLGDDVVMSILDTITLDAGIGNGYDWNTGDTTQTIEVFGSQGMGDYTYHVIVLNDNSCIGSDSINVMIVGLTNTSINQLEASNILLYPNPSTGLLNIVIEDLTATTEIEIFSENGQVIYKKKFDTISNSIVEQVDLSQNVSGIYFLSATSEGKTETSKFVLRNME